MAAFSPGRARSGRAQDKPVPTPVWVPKPIAIAGYTPPQRPWIKLPELKAAHRGDAELARAAGR